MNACLLCPFRCPNVSDFTNHILKFHNNDKRLCIKCSRCEATYNKAESYRKHVYRHHRDADLEEANENEEAELDDIDQEGEPGEAHMEQAGEVHMEQAGQHALSPKELLDNHCASFLLNLKSSPAITETNLADVIINTKQLLNDVNQITVSKLKSELETMGVDANDINFDLLTSHTVFDNLETKTKQEKYFIEKFDLLLPEKVQIGFETVLISMEKSVYTWSLNMGI